MIWSSDHWNVCTTKSILNNPKTFLTLFLDCTEAENIQQQQQQQQQMQSLREKQIREELEQNDWTIFKGIPICIEREYQNKGNTKQMYKQKHISNLFEMDKLFS